MTAFDASEWNFISSTLSAYGKRRFSNSIPKTSSVDFVEARMYPFPTKLFDGF